MGCAASQIQRAEQLRVGVFELGQAVVALVARHGGEYAAVVFKIELAAPAGHVLSGKAAFQLFKERQRSALACAGRAGDAVSKDVYKRQAVQGVTARVLPGTDKTARVRMPQASYRRTMMPLPSSARFTASTTTPGASTETKE